LTLSLVNVKLSTYFKMYKSFGCELILISYSSLRPKTYLTQKK